MKKLVEALENISGMALTDPHLDDPEELRQVIEAIRQVALSVRYKLTRTEKLFSTLTITKEIENADGPGVKLAGLEIAGCAFHAEIIRVHADSAGNAATTDAGQEEIDKLDVATSNSGNTMFVHDRKTFIMWIHPHEH